MKITILSVSLGLWFLAGNVISSDVSCRSGTKSTSVVLNAGDVFKFNTGGRRYEANIDCSASYELGATCSTAVVSCTRFVTQSNRRCTRGDIFTVTDANGSSRFCRRNKPTDLEVSGNFELKFTSDGDRQKRGLRCTVSCSDDGSGSGSGSSTTGEPGTSAGSRSYLAGLSYSFSADELKSPYCAGTLISSKWILTSAACSLSDQQKIGVDKVNVLLGEESLVTQNSEAYKVVSVSAIFYPNSYSGSSVEDNIALWKLSEAVNTGIYAPLCLPTKDSVASGTANLVGWRISTVPGSLSEEVVEKPVSLESADCPNNQLCGANEDKCQGDFGGPLVQSGTVIGVVSRDNGCSSGTSTSAIFTRVSSYIDFITTTINQNGGGSVC